MPPTCSHESNDETCDVCYPTLQGSPVAAPMDIEKRTSWLPRLNFSDGPEYNKSHDSLWDDGK